MASKRGGGESSNTGLIVALVFFVLTTIGLGVGTYMGYAGKAEADKAAKSANDAKTTADKKAREEQAQRLAVVIAAGAAQGNDMQTFNGLRSEAATLIQAQLNNLRHLPKWDLATQLDRPPKTYEALIEDLTRAAQAADTRRAAAERELATEKETAANTIGELQNRLKTSQDNLTKTNAAVVAAQAKKSDNFDQDQGTIERLGKELEQVKLDKENQAVDFGRQIKELNARLETTKLVRETFSARVGPVLEKLEQVKNNRPEVHELAELYEMLSRQFERAQSLANDIPKGRIISIDHHSGLVYIDLGSADFVQPQLTFSVLPAGSTGRAAAGRERKAAIEVVSVLEPHLSTAKVIDAVNSPARDPLMRGDLLFNPVWGPNQAMHVAIAGIVDLNGDGIDDTPDLKRQLEKQGVIVDAYLDLRTRSIVGPGISEKTTYLVLGEQPVPPSIIQENNPLVSATNEVLGKIADMKAKAKDLGVEPVQYRRFLSLIGYRLPKALQPGEYGASSYLRGVGGAQTKPDGDKDRIPK